MSAANCPETPRQKMIGMMYLFLTAMLALNVSRSILNAFVVVNHSLEATNEAFGEKNEYAYNDFANKKANNPEKVKAYYEAAMKVKELSEGIEKYLLDLKAKVIAETEKIPVEQAKKMKLKDIDAKDNFDIPTYILVGEKEDGSGGEARKLRNKLKEYKENLRKVLEDPKIQIPFKEKEIKSLGDFGVDTDDPKEKDPDHPEENHWETSKFEHTPLAAVVTMMSQIQNQIRNAEATVVNLLLNSISANDFKFDTLAAKVIPNSNYIIQGDKYKADLFVAAFSTTENPKILVGEGYDTVKNVLTGKIDSIPVEKGVGRLVRDATATGTQKYAAIIKVKKPDGTYKDYPLIVNGKHIIEYTVAKPSAVISPTKMNVLYIGVDNPIDISVAGFSADKISAGISSGSLSRKGGSSYIARVRRAGKCRISVSATDDNGNKRSMGSQEFRVKRVPDPVAKIANHKGGKIKKNILLSQAGIKADMENFDFDLKFRVVGFTVSVTIGGFEKSKNSGSYRLTGEQINLIRKAKKGSRVTFENIRAKGPDGSIRKLNSISLKLK